MSTALAGSPHSLFAGDAGPRRFGGPSMTLTERLEAVLVGVKEEGHAECPVCHAEMRRENGAARCGDCRSALA
jgi:hypothetical protein